MGARRIVTRRVAPVVALVALVGAAGAALASCTDFDGLSPADAVDGGDAGARDATTSDGARGDDATAAACSGPHEHFDPTTGHCYGFFANKIGWNAAESDCVFTFHGHLVSIASGAELSFVVELLRAEDATPPDSGSDGVWIGLHRPDAGAPYLWSDGEPLTFTNWAKGAGMTNPCVFQYGDQLQNHWDDFMCSVLARYVCERAP